MIALVLALKGPLHMQTIKEKNVTPFQGLKLFFIFPQGVALGWYVTPFQD
jgi:hypothetical protein